MHILYITQHFPPETGAAQGRAHEMARNLVNLGNQVTVLTGFPNYPDGIIPDEYKGKLYQQEEIDGINVVRTFLIPDTKSSKIIRILNYFSFMLSAIIGGLFIKKVDIVYASTPPLPVGVVGYVLSKVYNSKFALEIRDLWVDNAIELGQLKNKFAIKMVRNLESFLNREADKIIVVTEGFKKHLWKKGIKSDKIEVITNGFDEEVFKPGLRDNWVRKKYNLKEKFVIMYAGNMGTAQGLDFIIETAIKTRDHKNILYYLIGAGVKKESLMATVEERKLENVRFMDNQPKEVIGDFLAAADVLLISLKDLPIFEITIPSKVFDYMAMGRPILIGVSGEARRIVEEAKAGLYFTPGKAEEFKEAVFKLYHRPELRKEMGGKAREYAVENFSRQQLARKLNDILQKRQER